MINLALQNYKNNCKGWSAPSNLFYPVISSLSSYYSPAGSTSLVSVNGSNFQAYSTVSFGIYSPTVYFVNSTLIQFYVPTTLNYGTYPIQVFNGSIPSNSVNYNIDNASGYWLLNGAGTITNTNTSNSGLVAITSLSRGAPVTITNESSLNNAYIVPNNVNWIICNGTSINNDIYIGLPTSTNFVGREITIKSVGSSQVCSSYSNIIPLVSNTNTPTSIILSSSGKWVTLVYDGTYWITMQGN
jgi:hypothetical protein